MRLAREALRGEKSERLPFFLWTLARIRASVLSMSHVPRYKTGVHARVLKAFRARFRTFYKAAYPFDGASYRWPEGTVEGSALRSMPSLEENSEWLDRLVGCGSFSEIEQRMNRAFSSARLRAAGIDLQTIVCWWHSLASDGEFAARLRLVRQPRRPEEALR